ncbi:hypothetical protein UB45_13440 [Terrabacter sp. 28]|nr:hypothetical protein UB45_13440 [Terrabacter sp. 28]
MLSVCTEGLNELAVDQNVQVLEIRSPTRSFTEVSSVEIQFVTAAARGTSPASPHESRGRPSSARATPAQATFRKAVDGAWDPKHRGAPLT